MFCSNCGAAVQPTASFCQKCGSQLSRSVPPPTTPIAAATQEEGFSLWNPNAAANWSLIFTPAFGSYLQMLNWRTLGQHDKASSALNWFYVSLVVLLVYVLMGVFMQDSNAADGASRVLGFVYLLTWYFSTGRAQGKFVKERLGDTYTRRPWGKVLLMGIGAILGYFMLAVVVGLILGAAR